MKGELIPSGSAKFLMWARRIEQWQQSGRSQHAFCTERGLALSTFQWWRARLRRDELADSQSLFVPLPLDTRSEVTSSVIEVELRSGARIRFEGEAARAAVDGLVARVLSPDALVTIFQRLCNDLDGALRDIKIRWRGAEPT